MFESFSIDYLKITPLPLIHSMVAFGYLYEFYNQSIAYLTDTKGLPPKTASFLKDKVIDLLVIDTNHNNLNDSLEIYEHLKPFRTVLTHISHDFDIC